jgi:hypothetical protein
MLPVVSRPVSVRANFFSASSKDAVSRVTFKQSDIQKELDRLGLDPKMGDILLITLRFDNVPYQVMFKVNREGLTLKTTSWPQGLPKLQIGLTLHADVQHIIYITNAVVDRLQETTKAKVTVVTTNTRTY